MNKQTLKGAMVILAVYVATAAFQRHVMAVPVIGSYLPR